MDNARDARNLLLAVFVKNQGDWDKTLSDINDKRFVDSEYIDKCLASQSSFISITDQDYPEYLKNSYKTPFILFYEGNKELIKSEKLLAILNDQTSSIYADNSINSLCDSLIKNCVFVLPFGGVKQNQLIKRIISNNGSVIAVLNKSIGIENQTDKELYKELSANHLILSSLPKALDKSCIESAIQCYKLVATLGNRILIGAISKKSPQTVAVAMAIQNGCDVFCIPFQMGSKYIGNTLIHDGAILVENSETLLIEGKLE